MNAFLDQFRCATSLATKAWQNRSGESPTGYAMLFLAIGLGVIAASSMSGNMMVQLYCLFVCILAGIFVRGEINAKKSSPDLRR